MNYETIRKNAMVKSSLPEGWGRSVVNGKEIITAPTVKAEKNINKDFDLLDQDDYFDEKINNADYLYEEPERVTDEELDNEARDAFNLFQMGRMSAYDENTDTTAMYEKDLSDPNAFWINPETGLRLFETLEEQKIRDKEFIKTFGGK